MIGGNLSINQLISRSGIFWSICGERWKLHHHHYDVSLLHLHRQTKQGGPRSHEFIRVHHLCQSDNKTLLMKPILTSSYPTGGTESHNGGELYVVFSAGERSQSDIRPRPTAIFPDNILSRESTWRCNQCYWHELVIIIQ